MSTLIVRKDTFGLVSGRCDARCYNARGPKCTCICSGINHGKGKNYAILKTARHFHFLQAVDDFRTFIIKPAQYELFKAGEL
ncbi:hypothetical protein ES703_80243 [subsurface metagenome]